jgi:hypothetical protein
MTIVDYFYHFIWSITMNIKLNILSAAVLAVVSTAAVSAEPPAVPGIYSAGPQSPLVASTDLSLAERTAYANYEAIMQIAEARIHATSCSNSAGSFAITAFSDGSVNNPDQNFATVLSNASSFTVKSKSAAPDTVDNRGQLISVDMPAGSLAGRAVRLYHADLAYNGVNNMMDSTSSVEVNSINGRFDKYYGKVIKDFYRGALVDTDLEYFNIYDWGLQSLDKLGYPVNKYWQRSKSHRDDGTIGRTVFVKDRLVGSTSCRIIIDTTGFNNQDFFQQTGNLKIQTGVTPGAAVPEFGQYPF